MQDTFGVYYYPVPGHKSIRMYVRKNQEVIEFRLHNDKDPQLWAEHGWLSYEAVRQAAQMYNQRNGTDPLKLYDFDVALHVLNNAQDDAAH